MSSRDLDGGGRFGVDDGVCLWGLTKWIDLFSDIITFLKSSSLSSLPCLRTEDVLGRTPKACWIGNVSTDETKICMRIETCTGTRTHARMHTNTVTLKKPDGVLYQRACPNKPSNPSRPLILFMLHIRFFPSSHLSL